jgi:hypothetical protein
MLAGQTYSSNLAVPSNANSPLSGKRLDLSIRPARILNSRFLRLQTQAFAFPNKYLHRYSALSSYLAQIIFVFAFKRVEGKTEASF